MNAIDTGTGAGPAAAPDCEECGFAYADVDATEVPARLRAFARKYRAPLTRFLPGEDGDAIVRLRPAPGTWSALEYAAHVRDVFESYDRWIAQTLAEDRPTLEGAGPDELAAERAYNDDDREAVAEAIAVNAERLARSIDAVAADGWDRVGLRRDEERSVLFTARRAVHEGNHHLLDIGRGLRSVRDQANSA